MGCARILCVVLTCLTLLALSTSLVYAQPKAAKTTEAPSRVAAKTDAAPAEPATAVSKDGLYDIDATATDVKFVLEALARRSGDNIVVSPEVTGDVSIHVKQQSVDAILENLATVQGIAWKKSGDTYLVGTKDKINAKPIAAEAVAPPEPKTLVWKCRSVKPVDLATMITKLYPDLKAAEGPNQAQPKLGATPTTTEGGLNTTATTSTAQDSTAATLVVMGKPDEVDKVQVLLNALDAPPMQVAIEVAITEVSNSADKNLGVDWSWSDLTLKESNPGSVSFGKFSKSGQTFVGTINALINSNSAKLLAQPNISVVDGANAEILIGDRILFPKLVGYNQVGAPIYDKAEERVGIYLQLAVKINDDSQILMTLYPQVSLVTKYLSTSAGSYPQISTREARTTVLVKDGATLAIGGLIQDNDIREGTAVPVLGKLPIIGQLFRRNKTTKDHSELVIFLTPRIVKSS